MEAHRISEFRILALEQSRDGQERRISLLETEHATVSERLNTMVAIAAQLASKVENINTAQTTLVTSQKESENRLITGQKDAQARLMSGIIITLITVLITFALGHFGPK